MIEVQNVSMKYGSFKALDDISFKAYEGQVLGFLGPNGAGKTTTMRVLTTYLCPSAGNINICGVDGISNPLDVRQMTGYLPESAPLYLDMRVDEYLLFVAKARGIASKNIYDRLQWLVDVCGLEKIWKHRIFEVSKGYKQRVGIAQALIHDPKVLILDEPMSGLDPIQILEIRNLIKSLSKNKTIIFSTHILQEVEAIADRLAIIHQGKMIAEGTRNELENSIHKENASLENIFIELLQQSTVIS